MLWDTTMNSLDFFYFPMRGIFHQEHCLYRGTTVCWKKKATGRGTTISISHQAAPIEIEHYLVYNPLSQRHNMRRRENMLSRKKHRTQNAETRQEYVQEIVNWTKKMRIATKSSLIIPQVHAWQKCLLKSCISCCS